MVQTLVTPQKPGAAGSSSHEGPRRKEIVTVQGLSKRYRKHDAPAVDNVSLNITRGSVFGLIGPDGAGKTTIIQVLAGVVRPDAGSVRVAGIDVVRNAEGIKPLIGYMPQGLGQNLYETLSIQENILFFKNLRQVPEERFRINSERLLKMTRLDAFLSRPAGKLSGGMRQKLAGQLLAHASRELAGGSGEKGIEAGHLEQTLAVDAKALLGHLTQVLEKEDVFLDGQRLVEVLPQPLRHVADQGLDAFCIPDHIDASHPD